MKLITLILLSILLSSVITNWWVGYENRKLKQELKTLRQYCKARGGTDWTGWYKLWLNEQYIIYHSTWTEKRNQ